MARINIEECWWTDPRRSRLAKLVGDENQADGIAIRMWRLAQEFWGKSRGLVPEAIFSSLEAAPKLIEAGLAEIRTDGVYVRGSSQYLDWAFENRERAREAGKKGGLASAKSRLEKNGSAVPNGASNGKTPKRRRSKTEAKPGEPKPSDSVSDSVSVSDSDSSSSTDSVSNTGQSVIANYCDRWKIRYGTYPTFQDKDAKNLKRFAESVGLARAKDLIGSFLLMNDQWYLTKRHDIQTFLNNLNAVTQFHDTGRALTRSEIQSVDRTQTNFNTLQKLKAGDI